MARCLRYESIGALKHCTSTQTQAAHLSPSRAIRTRSYSTLQQPNIPKYAFVFDIDGVILRSAQPIPGARAALAELQKSQVPFIFLTNGGGKFESERVAELKQKLDVHLEDSQLVQSHTPIAGLAEQYSPRRHSNSCGDKSVLVVGGNGDSCRKVAERYGFRRVVTPADIVTAQPTIWPFSQALMQHYKSFARPLPGSIAPNHPDLEISAIFVFNDSRDWGLDIQVMLDLLLSHKGVLGTRSKLNGRDDLPNRGYQSDGQPKLWFTNPDLQWAASHHMPRLGQGAFIDVFEGIWDAITGGPAKGVKLRKTVIGKPHYETYEFAERRLMEYRIEAVERATGRKPREALRRIYMVGDNPASDITGANQYKSTLRLQGEDGHILSTPEWTSVLVKTGVFRESEGEPSPMPTKIADDVLQAVKWAMQRESRE